MAYIDRTHDFRDLAASKRAALPEAKRRKLTPPALEGDALAGKQFISEAYTILTHLDTLTRMLAQVRKPYLAIDGRARPGHAPARAPEGMDAWGGVKHLTNAERDQIDTQARTILARCSERVRTMEAVEKKRAELSAHPPNPLARILPARLLAPPTPDMRAVHHAGITYYLSRRLAAASAAQKEMQEERVKRTMERTRTLGAGAGKDAAGMGLGDPPLVQSGGGWSSALASGLAATIGAPAPEDAPQPKASAPPPHVVDADLSDSDTDSLELSQSQILQFESENAHILQQAQDTLAAVHHAEAALADISNLQLELITHLERQSALSDQLYADAVDAQGQVERGNVQLREAKRRARDGRKWVVLFLIGASLSLLFLHYY